MTKRIRIKGLAKVRQTIRNMGRWDYRISEEDRRRLERQARKDHPTCRGTIVGTAMESGKAGDTITIKLHP